jgi:hypothetical protein
MPSVVLAPRLRLTVAIALARDRSRDAVADRRHPGA